MSEPAVPKPRPKLRRYLVLSLVLLPFTMLGDLALRLQNAGLHERLLEFSEKLGQSVEALDPFALTRAFYSRLVESEYTWKPLAWAAPFNLSEARRRFRAEHPGCPDPGGLSLDSEQLRIFQHFRPTPVRLDLLRGTDPLQPRISGSQAAALVNEPVPTPVLRPLSELLANQAAPTPVLRPLSELLGESPTSSADRIALSLFLGTPTPQRRLHSLLSGLDPNGTELFEALSFSTPTPRPSLFSFPTPLVGLAGRMNLEAGLLPGVTVPLCTEEQRQEAESLRENLVAGGRPVQLFFGLPDAVLQMARQAKEGLDGGLASALVVLLVLLCGAALFWALLETHPLALLALPLLAGILVWVLLLPVRLALVLFPHALSAVELFAFVATLPPVLWLVQIGFAVAQTAAVDKAMAAQDKKDSG